MYIFTKKFSYQNDGDLYLVIKELSRSNTFRIYLCGFWKYPVVLGPDLWSLLFMVFVPLFDITRKQWKTLLNKRCHLGVLWTIFVLHKIAFYIIFSKQVSIFLHIKSLHDDLYSRPFSPIICRYIILYKFWIITMLMFTINKWIIKYIFVLRICVHVVRFSQPAG